MNYLRLTIVVAFAVACATTYAGGVSNLPGNFVVEPERYVGLWYEQARTPNDFEDNFIERDGQTYGPCFNATAFYEIRNERSLTIRNECSRESASNEVTQDVARGIAKIVPDSQGRKLKVAFGNVFSRVLMRLFTGGGANYWIYDLGPVGDDGKYEWALVSGAERDFIFILTRDQFIADELQSDIVSRASELGMPTDQLIFRQREVE